MTAAIPSQNPANQATQVFNPGRNSSVEAEIRKGLFEKCQREHLSCSLFPLNDILVAPRLLARVQIPGPDDLPQYTPVLFQTLPNLYATPELVAGLPYPSISLEKALQGSSRIAVCGYAGSGKTTLLADLASRICSRQPSLGTLTAYLPIFLHCRDILHSSTSREDIFQPLVRYLLGITKRRDDKVMHATLQAAASENQLLLLIDGLDELPPTSSSRTVQWLRQVVKEFPSVKIVTTTNPNFHPSLTELGFSELAIAPWSDGEKVAFVDKFAQAWSSCYQQSEESSFIPKWLRTSKLPGSPLEVTLACWSALTGNSINLQGTSIFTPYLNIVCQHPLSPATLISIAVAEVNSGFAGITFGALESLVVTDPMFKSKTVQELTLPDATPAASQTPPSGPAPRDVIIELLAAGILAQSVQGRYIFKSAHLCAALYVQASTSNLPITWQAASLFSFTDSLLVFSCATGKANTQISKWLNEIDYPLFRNYHLISHCLTAYPSLNRELLVQTYKKIIPLIQKSALPLSLQIKLLSPLLRSTEPATFSFFKELASSKVNTQRQAAAFCLSYYSSAESDALLNTLLSDGDRQVQKLACIALAKSWSTSAQKSLVNLVTSGHPELRQIIGELFAFIPGDGYELLKELVILPNNPEARKAAVDGLLLVNSEWSKTLINKVNIEDTEWLVRDTAANAIKLNSVDHLFRTRRKVAPAYLPWLIKFAASKRMGIYADEFPTDILILAVKEGGPLIQAAAFETLASDSSSVSIHFLKQAFLNARGTLQELAYSGLDSLSRRGIDLNK